MARTLVDVERRSVKQLMLADLAKSGLNQHARRLALRALDSHEVKRLWSGFHEAGAMKIPYWTLDGRPSKFFRVRYLEKLPGAAGAAKNPQRYDQIPVLQDAYYPPILKQPWNKIAKDPKIGLGITEGEKKAACACSRGIPMLALGGVYSFMSSKRDVDLLPSMKEIVWEDRDVYIVYDNDLVSNPDVMRAQHRLSQRLLSEGAKIKYISIPQGSHKGVDDYIVARGAKAFVELIEKAEPFLEGEALWQLNTEVVFVKKQDVVIERATGLVMDPDRFMRHQYVDRHYMKKIEKGSGKSKHFVQQEEKLAPRWMEWPHKSKLWDMTYEPGQPKVVGESWNMWNGWAITPKRGPVGPWEWLLDFLFWKDDKSRTYFEQWCAYPIVHPGAKLFAACLLWSQVKRIGKSSVGLALSKIYGENAYTIGTRQLKSQFNKWALNRQLVIGEEISAGKDHIDADYMKYLITSPTFPIRAMYRDEFEIPNHSNFLFFSNWPDAMFLEDNDKRYMIHAVRRSEADKRAVQDKYQEFHRWLREDGARHLMWHLTERVSFRGFEPHGPPPESASKWEMIQIVKNNVGLWAQKLLEDPVSALRSLGQRLSEECDLFSAEQLYRAFDPNEKESRGGASSIGKHLHARGFHLLNNAIPVPTSSGIHRLYAVRNFTKWDQATRKEIREHYDKFFGPQAEGRVK